MGAITLTDIDDVVRFLQIKEKQREIERQFQNSYPALKKVKGFIDVLDAAFLETIAGNNFNIQGLAMRLMPKYYSETSLTPAINVVKALIKEGFLHPLYPDKKRGNLMISAAFYDEYIGHLLNMDLEASLPKYKLWQSAENNFTGCYLHGRGNIISEVVVPAPPEILALKVGDHMLDFAHGQNIKARKGRRSAENEMLHTWDRMLKGGAPVNIQMLANSPHHTPVLVQVHVDMDGGTKPQKTFKYRVVDRLEPAHESEAIFYVNKKSEVTGYEEPWPARMPTPVIGMTMFQFSAVENVKRRRGLVAMTKSASNSFARLESGGGPIITRSQIKFKDGTEPWVRVIADLVGTNPPLKRTRLILPDK